ncbi:NADH:flavin oxidoreductase/NADH oxidase family protein [Litorivivens sp.]|uniref:NADH:flavin oxidoreductase/NADH oxidase family protein n=1 Tax=Litorivivens sp. TaxID=2020868 RepID=UPI003569A674
MTILNTPLTLPCGAILPNRLLKSAMTEGLADAHDRATEQHNTLYRCWSRGGTGTLVTGNVMVDRRFLERPGNVVIDNNGGLDALRNWAKAGTEAGNHLWMQINHPGRQCQKLVAARPLAPSEVKLKLAGLFGQPRAMTADDIDNTLSRYAHVAGVAKQTGFTGVQIHAAHGYLISQFLSPIANRRSDAWGGNLENRARFLLEAVRRTRDVVGTDFPISVKLNSADFSQGGFSLDESTQVARWLEQTGIDLLEISGGTYEQLALMGDTPAASASQAREAYFLSYAKEIRSATSLPLAVTGGFRSSNTMHAALADNALDVIGLGRPLCTQPNVHELLNGEDVTFTPWEKRLRLGPGWLGPTSSNRQIRALNFGAATQWYYRHIVDLANHRQPDTGDKNLLRIFARHRRAEMAFVKNRAFNV